MEYCAGIVVILAVLEEILAGERSLVREEGDMNGPDGGVQSGGRGGIRLTGILGRHDKWEVGKATLCAGESMAILKSPEGKSTLRSSEKSGRHGT